MTRKGRQLSREERAQWDSVARKAQPLAPRPKAAAAAPPPSPRATPVAEPVPDFTLGVRAQTARPNDVSPPLRDRLRAAPVQMDARTHARMLSGKLKPEARLDLHGMFRDEAYPALIDFVLGSHARGRRLVLVITGQGADPGDWTGGRGILRRQVPQWLALPPLAPVVMQLQSAHRRHGGDGAFYLYLRRPK